MGKEFQSPAGVKSGVPTPSGDSDWGATYGGDASLGQGAAPKGTQGEMKEVTFVSIEGDPGPGGKVERGPIAGPYRDFSKK